MLLPAPREGQGARTAFRKAPQASPPETRFTVEVNDFLERYKLLELGLSSSARACARATPTGTLTSAVVVVVAASTVVAAAADVADAGTRTRTWRGEWERGKWVARSKC